MWSEVLKRKPEVSDVSTAPSKIGHFLHLKVLSIDRTISSLSGIMAAYEPIAANLEIHHA